MEQVYRRRGEYAKVHRQRSEESGRLHYAPTKRIAVCIILLAGALVVRFSGAESLLPAKDAITRILQEHTDFAGVPGKVKEFLAKGTEQKSLPEELGSKEVLMNMKVPTEAVVSSPFGLRQDPQSGEEKFHYGVDLAAAEGTDIFAAAPGQVVECGFSDSYGNYLLLQHSESIFTLYAHCSELLTGQDETVEQGEKIALMGSTGNVTGPHLHFEIRDGDTWLDPAEFMRLKKDSVNG
ncbi:MAG: M23 family metallopeptidase [Ruminococcaceae bacterium]|nr:M23 family metallopeptidase [Oscillospiraceae bacterium]